MPAAGFVMVPAWVRTTDLTGVSKLVYISLLAHADQGGTCWPSHRRLARESASSVRTVQRALCDLRDRGLVTWEPRVSDDGSPMSNLYRLTDPYVTVADPPVTVTQGVGHADRGATSEGPGGPVTVADELDPSELDPLNQTQGTLTLAVEPPDRFDEFWAIYPRKVSKPDARKAWTTALKRTDAQTVIDGAHRYADDPNRDPSYTKHPGTWLRNDCWNDGPLPARGRTSHAVSTGSSRALSTLELARRYAEQEAQEGAHRAAIADRPAAG